MKDVRNPYWHTAIIMLRGLLVLLAFLFVPFAVFAEEPRLTGPDVSVKTGQPFVITVQYAPADSPIQWTWHNRLTCRKTFSHILSCKLERLLLTEESLNVEVGATIDKLKWSRTR